MFTLHTLAFALSDSCASAAMLPIWESNARKVERIRRSFGYKNALETDVFESLNAAAYLRAEARVAAYESGVNAFWFPLMPFDVIENRRTLTRACEIWDAENAWRNDAD